MIFNYADYMPTCDEGYDYETARQELREWYEEHPEAMEADANV